MSASIWCQEAGSALSLEIFCCTVIIRYRYSAVVIAIQQLAPVQYYSVVQSCTLFKSCTAQRQLVAECTRMKGSQICINWSTNINIHSWVLCACGISPFGSSKSHATMASCLCAWPCAVCLSLAGRHWRWVQGLHWEAPGAESTPSRLPASLARAQTRQCVSVCT